MPEPQRRRDIQLGVLQSPVMHGDLHEQILRRGFRILDHDVEIPVLVEDPGIEQLEFGI
jgi:hypothetical protein